MKSLTSLGIMALLLIELGSGSSAVPLTVPNWKPMLVEPCTLKYHRPTACRHLYNVGKHKEWSECMGVGYKPRRDM